MGIMTDKTVVKENLNEKTATVLAGNESNSQLEEMAEFLHQQALNNPNKSVECAKKCAIVLGKGTSKKNANFCAFIQILLWKCYGMFYSYKKREDGVIEATTKTSSVEQNDRLLANSSFISELYNESIVPDSSFWCLVMDLMRENGNVQVYCLANMINLGGIKLSKTYSLTRIIGHLLILDKKARREEVMRPDQHKLLHDLKVMHAKYWIHTVPEKTVKDNFRSINENLIKPNKTDNVRIQYELSIMAECTLEDCRELHMKLIIRNDWDMDVTRFLSPALHALMSTNPTGFVVNVIVTTVDEENHRVKTNAAKLLAELVKAELLSRFVVYTGLEEVRQENALYKNSVDCIGEEYAKHLRTNK